MRTVQEAYCPWCSRRLHAPSEAALDLQALRHVRNCNAKKQDEAALDAIVETANAQVEAAP